MKRRNSNKRLRHIFSELEQTRFMRFMQTLRHYWQLGMKYQGLPNITITVATFTGVWLKGTALDDYMYWFFAISVVLVIVLILVAGYLDRNLGFIEKDQTMNAWKNPMWRRQMEVNDDVLRRLDAQQANNRRLEEKIDTLMEASQKTNQKTSHESSHEDHDDE